MCAPCRYQQHMKAEVQDILAEYKIGTLAGRPWGSVLRWLGLAARMPLLSVVVS